MDVNDKMYRRKRAIKMLEEVSLKSFCDGIAVNQPDYHESGAKFSLDEYIKNNL